MRPEGGLQSGGCSNSPGVTRGMGERGEVSVLDDIDRTLRLIRCNEREQKGCKGTKSPGGVTQSTGPHPESADEAGASLEWVVKLASVLGIVNVLKRAAG